MSEAYVFLGPTLTEKEARAELDANYLPPASAGDVYRLWRHRPRVIGIVDGHADGIPAVWHKEIMWVMERGVHVFGSAAMGALRAAELTSFGMRGAGWVYEAFRDGVLDRDDEVTVRHGPAKDGYRPQSEALVDIRRTLHAAAREAVVSSATADRLIATGSAMFYQDRTWPALIQAVGAAGADAAELGALSRWLPDGQVAQQANDARAMLRQIRAFLATDPDPLRVTWTMANTTAFQAARLRAESAAAGPAVSAQDDAPLSHERVLDEIRLLGPSAFEAARIRGLLRVFAAYFAERVGMTVEGDQLRDAVASSRTSLGLGQDAEFTRFLAASGLSASDFERLAADDEMIRWAVGQARWEAASALIDDLRMRGEYVRLAARAAAKPGHPGPSQDPQQEREAIRWYFAERHGTPPPDDLEGYARACGFAGVPDFRRAVISEYHYTRHEGR